MIVMIRVSSWNRFFDRLLSYYSPQKRLSSLDTKHLEEETASSGIKVPDDWLLPQAQSATTNSSCSIQDDLAPEILRHIFSFVGGREYRFVGTVSKSFRIHYIAQYPEKVTSSAFAGFSVDLAKTYYDEQKFIPGYNQISDKEKKIKIITREAILKHNFDVLEWLITRKWMSHELKTCMFDTSIRTGKVEYLRYLLSKESDLANTVSVSSIEYAALHGHLAVLQFLFENCSIHNNIQSSRACENAAKRGHLECLQYLHDQGIELDGMCYYRAAQGDHLDCIQYLHEKHCPWFLPWDHNNEFVEPAQLLEMGEMGVKSSFRCLQYLHEHVWRSHLYPKFLDGAMISGNIQCIQYIENKTEQRERSIIQTPSPWAVRFGYAALSGNLECLQYLHQKGYPLSEALTRAASSVGSIACLRYLHENNCPLDGQCCMIEATKAGSLECLQYLHDIGYKPKSEECCQAAIQWGHLHCLQYLHEKGYQWNKKDSCYVAVRNQQMPCLQYLHENGCDLSPELYWVCIWMIVYRVGKISETVTCLQYLQNAVVDTPFTAIKLALEHNMESMFQYFNLDAFLNDDAIGKRPRKKSFLKAIRNKWSLITLRRLYKDEWENDPMFCIEAAQYGSLQILEYLLNNGFQASMDICNDAAESGYIDCLKFLHERGFVVNQETLDAANTSDCIKYCSDYVRQLRPRKRSASDAFNDKVLSEEEEI